MSNFGKRSNQFPGLCVGGPMAGKLYTGDSMHCQFDERPPLRTALELSLSAVPPERMEAKTHNYTWCHIGPFALWVHEDLNLNTALHALADAYQEKHNG